MTEQERKTLISGFSFEGEIDDCEGVFMFTVKKDFDLAAAFESIYNPEQDPPIERIEIAYRIRDQLVWYTLTLVLERQDGMWDNMRRVFPLNDGERDILKDKMDNYCYQEKGMSLLEYGILHWDETDGPEPTLTELTAQTRLEQPMPQLISSFDFMEMFATQFVEQMVQDIQSRVTPEKWGKIVAEAQVTGMDSTIG